MKLLLCLLCLNTLACYSQIFKSNEGQFRSTKNQLVEDVLYTSEADGLSYFFQKDRVSIVLSKTVRNNEDEGYKMTERIDLMFIEGSAFEIESNNQIQTHYNYYKNNTYHQVKAYASITYKNVWPDVDIHFYGKDGHMKWDYIVHPGGDISSIKVFHTGAERSISEKEITFKAKLGTLRFKYPKAYQIANGNEASIGLQIKQLSHAYCFDVGGLGYDHSKDLIIDPWVCYLGGADVDENYGIDVDQNGNIYTSGYTLGTDFPTTVGVVDTSADLDYDAFVSKFDSTGALLWSTYYAGSGGDYGRKVKADALGNCYHFGNSTSTDLMMSASGVYQNTNNGSYDSYIVKLNSAGQFIWASYFGGTNGDLALAGDLKDDRLVLAGFTASMNMPVVNGYQNMHGGALDGFAAVFDTTGNLMWSTFYGGSNSEDVHGVCFDEVGNVLICGDSYSNNLSTSPGAFQTYNNGSQECYVVKFDPTGQRIFATYFGGAANDDALAIKANHEKIYIVGFSKSNDFPITPDAYKDSLTSLKDGHITVFDANGGLLYASYYGGNGDDEFSDIDISDHKIMCLMNTQSSGLDLYGVPYSSAYIQNYDNYVIQFDTALNPGYSSYLGSTDNELAYSVKMGDDQTVHWSGFTESTDLAFGNVFETTAKGFTDGFVVKLNMITGTYVGTHILRVNDFNVYPNPAHNIIHIDNTDNEEVWLSIYDASGKQKLRQLMPKGTVTLQVELLAAGQYFCVLENQKGRPMKQATFIKN